MSKIIPNQTLEELNEIPTNIIAENLGITLDRNLQGDCPTGHGSKGHKCFSISKRLNLFHCFNCHISGNNIQLVQLVLNLNFNEACQWLAEQYRPDLLQQIQNYSPADYQQYQQEKNFLDQVYQALTISANYQHELLKVNSIAQGYFKTRGIQESQLWENKYFSFGYSPANDTKLYKTLVKQFSPEIALATGLFQNFNGEVKPFFKDLITVAYLVGGQIKYIVGRSPSTTEKIFRKLQTKNNSEYSKITNQLFGVDSLEIKNDFFKNSCLIAEGLFDAILAILNGIPTISPLTTRIPEEQIPDILKYTKNLNTVYICPDIEENQSGLSGAIKTAKILFQADRDINIITLPKPEEVEKIDLADYFTAGHTLEDFIELCKNALPLIDFLIELIPPNYDKTKLNDKLQELEITQLIQYQQNPITTEHYQDKISRRFKLKKKTIESLFKPNEKRQIPKDNKNNQTLEAQALKNILPSAPNSETFLLPSNWILNQQGLIKLAHTKEGPKELPVTPAPFYVSSRSINLDTRQEKLEITYLRDENWKTFYEERSTLLDHRKIVQLASKGFPVNSLNCKEIVHFISDFESINDKKLPKQTTISGFGWKREKNTLYFVLPNKAYGTDISIIFEPEGIGDEKLAKALRQEGAFKLWKTAITRLIDYPRAMFHVYAGFAPPLLELLDAPNFIIDNWGLTSTGKTTVISITASIWGLPIKEQGGLVLPSDATKVSIERLACLSNHLVILLDDTQTANDKVLSQILYMLANGIGRQRGALKGMQKTSSWRTIAFTTGERQLSEVTEYEGAKARTISLYGSPFGEKRQPELIHKIKSIIHSNYGHAGPIFIQHLIDKGYTNSRREELRKDYREITADLAKLGSDNVSDRIAQYLGAVYVAGRLAEDIFGFGGDVEVIIREILRDSLGQLKESGDYPQRALELIISWVQTNQNSFDKSELQADVERGEVYGIIREGEYIGIFPHKFKELLQKHKFSYSTILKAFKERKWIQTTKSDNTYPIGFRSKVIRMIKLQWNSFNHLWF